MESKKQTNLTEGPILQVLTKLALPIMASSFLSTAYSITDMAWIGKLGAKAVAGVGVGGMYVWLAQGLASLARMGGQVRLAQALGRNDREEAKHYAKASMQLILLFSVIFGAICLMFSDGLVSFFALEDVVTIRYAKIYLQITCGCIAFSYISYTLTGLYTAQGDSKTPLIANAIGLVVNMILDPVLILGLGIAPRMEVVGAAVATVFSQFLVMLVLILGIFYGKKYENILREVSILNRPEKYYISQVVKLGGPTSLQGTIYCGISMILTRLVSAFGEGAIATQRVGGQIESVSWNTADGFAAAMNAFTAQNYGAGKMDRVRKGYRMSALILAIWGSIVAVVFILFPTGISEMFFHEAEVIPICVSYLVVIGIGEPFMCIELLAIGAISGMGNTKLCSIISIIFTTLRIPLALFLSSTSLGLNGIWWALTVSSMAKGILLHFAFYRQCRIAEKNFRF
ncbi:MAG: MATE family efflux transporter [Lachnospiraceae bacterium]|nr:MATE family efflux transporter [Lachnospiraceae bacterium]